VDRLKIDRSFVRNLHADPDDRALVTAMIKMAHTLGLGVVAEGVEDFTQLLHLQDEACDHAQGYLLSRPLTVADARSFLIKISANQETGRTARLRNLTHPTTGD
jgi:EAL domain-containing protein (putative c-di-GMP-specific phosphodiesterase class I)